MDMRRLPHCGGGNFFEAHAREAQKHKKVGGTEPVPPNPPVYNGALSLNNCSGMATSVARATRAGSRWASESCYRQLRSPAQIAA